MSAASGKQRRLRFAGLAALAAGLLILDILTGQGGLGLPDGGGVILWKLRLPRGICAFACGASLSLAGAQMQSVLRNPLADPHIMGVSGGAGLGAALATLAAGSLAVPGAGIAAAAFAGAAAASALIVFMSAKVKSGVTLLIAGVMLGFIFSAISSILQFTASEQSLKLFYSWMAGSFSGCRWEDIAVIGSALAAGTAIAGINSRGMDIILFGEDYAALSGAKVRRIRILAMLSCCILTGAVTAFCGPLGFVGIVAPHIARRVFRTSVHATVIPGAMLSGAVLALTADLAANLWPVPLPVGSTMAVIGIPLIAAIMFTSDRDA